MVASNRIKHSRYRHALKEMQNRPTVNRLFFLLRYSPRMSSPPVEQPQLSTSPAAKPTRMPPTMQLVSGSGIMGTAGEGISARNTELDMVQIPAFRQNVRPSVRNASRNSGMFTKKYSTPARSKEVSTPSFVCSSVRMTWHRPYAPPAYSPWGTMNTLMATLISSEPSSPPTRRSPLLCISFVYKRLRSSLACNKSRTGIISIRPPLVKAFFVLITGCTPKNAAAAPAPGGDTGTRWTC